MGFASTSLSLRWPLDIFPGSIGRFLLCFSSSHDRMCKVPCVGKEEADCFGSPVWNRCRSCAVETRKLHSHRLPEIAKDKFCSQACAARMVSVHIAMPRPLLPKTTRPKPRALASTKHQTRESEAQKQLQSRPRWLVRFSHEFLFPDKNHFQRRTPGVCSQIQFLLHPVSAFVTALQVNAVRASTRCVSRRFVVQRSTIYVDSLFIF